MECLNGLELKARENAEFIGKGSVKMKIILKNIPHSKAYEKEFMKKLIKIAPEKANAYYVAIEDNKNYFTENKDFGVIKDHLILFYNIKK